MARRPLIGFVLVLLLAGSAEAQSRLNFPRVLPLQELRTTGFGLVNTASSPVVANFTFWLVILRPFLREPALLRNLRNSL